MNDHQDQPLNAAPVAFFFRLPHSAFRPLSLLTLFLASCSGLGSFSGHEEPIVRSTPDRPADSAGNPDEDRKSAVAEVRLDTTDDQTVKASLEAMMEGWSRPRRRQLTEAVGRCVTAAGDENAKPESEMFKSVKGLTATEILAKAQALDDAEDQPRVSRRDDENDEP